MTLEPEREETMRLPAESKILMLTLAFLLECLQMWHNKTEFSEILVLSSGEGEEEVTIYLYRNHIFYLFK